MDWETVFKFITASTASIGIGGAAIFALSSWLGKVWANRILADQTHELASALEKTKRELDLIKETTLRFQNDKILTYRATIDVVSRILSSFDSHEMGRLQPHEAGSRFDEFNEQRMRVYGYLAMLAPQSVMDAQDKLMDHLLKISNGTEKYVWSDVRELALNMLNEARKDIGIDKRSIVYNGDL
ncbi:hypothetical protein [Oceanimonas doudoroffii]|uniref:Uncharacterized protein n=1 Tax=Oceanimonas doudoroffii TaxID=84158 RepID=A0A233RJE5_9GAMM|nr:hypothetical protein [Oceanimonas doudoroffii]OXY83510.1 hypothetical protein B6S08_08505 [Oceanimonas doudoroffii]